MAVPSQLQQALPQVGPRVDLEGDAHEVALEFAVAVLLAVEGVELEQFVEGSLLEVAEEGVHVVEVDQLHGSAFVVAVGEGDVVELVAGDCLLVVQREEQLQLVLGSGQPVDAEEDVLPGLFIAVEVFLVDLQEVLEDYDLLLPFVEVEVYVVLRGEFGEVPHLHVKVVSD